MLGHDLPQPQTKMFNLQAFRTNLQFIGNRGTSEQVKPHQEKTIGQSHFTGQMTQFLNMPNARMGMGGRENHSR